MVDIFQKEIAEKTAQAIGKAYPDRIADVAAALGISAEELPDYIYGKLEVPKDSELGDLAFPTFLLAKALKENPAAIAQKVVKAVEADGVKAIGPYINFMLTAPEIAEVILPAVFKKGENYGGQSKGQGKNIVIDYSSPNIAKPFGVGHLRSTAIGAALYRIYEKLGYRSIGINHIGDWGTQFGKIIVAYEKWGNREQFEAEPVLTLYDLYVRFHDEEKKNPELTEEARARFKMLEEADTETVRLWELFKDHSLKEFRRIYDLLGVEFDHFTGESFYKDKTEAVIKRLEDAGLAVESRGAQVVELEQYGLPACLLKKADGATLYSTRDLAGIFYRYEAYRFDKVLYVVGSAQREHFKQVFKVVKLLGEAYADRLEHVEFGWIRFDKKVMSSRRGNIVFLDDVIRTAFDKVKEIIIEKNPDLPDLEDTARKVAVGAIIFADLGVKRHKDIDFLWDEVLNFEGETGPYLQYTHARLCALERKYGKKISADVNFDLFESAEEKALLLHLHRFGQTVELAAEKNEPNFIAAYLLELAAIFNRFYQRKDAQGRLVKIISENEKETRARMLLVLAVRTVLKEGLRLLGIEAPEEM